MRSARAAAAMALCAALVLGAGVAAYAVGRSSRTSEQDAAHIKARAERSAYLESERLAVKRAEPRGYAVGLAAGRRRGIERASHMARTDAAVVRARQKASKAAARTRTAAAAPASEAAGRPQKVRRAVRRCASARRSGTARRPCRALRRPQRRQRPRRRRRPAPARRCARLRGECIEGA